MVDRVVDFKKRYRPAVINPVRFDTTDATMESVTNGLLGLFLSPNEPTKKNGITKV
jgi:hypothetical protein